ncbi:PAS domain-containing protein [Glacieibacterium frigidum]|nr:PAS domain-containing protein [Glacieibacterium frigidum]
MATRLDSEDRRILRVMSRSTAWSAATSLPLQLPVDADVRHPLGFMLRGGIGIVTGGIGTAIDWANDSFLTMSGYSREDIATGRLDWATLTPADWHDEDRRRLAVSRTTGFAVVYQKQLWRADGSRMPVLFGYTLDAGPPTAFVVDLTAATSAAPRTDAEAHHARFFEISHVAFWTADAQGRMIFSSRRIAERLGTDVALDDEAAQAELIHPDDRALAVSTWQHAIASGMAYDLEVRARGLDGAPYRWTRLRASPDHDAHGRVVGWYGTSEDVHDRHLAGIALAESEMRFKRLVDDMPVMVWLTDADNQTTYMSRRWYEFTGQTEAQAMGLGWVDAILPEDRPRLAPIRRMIRAGRPFELDFRVRRADGEARWVMSAGLPRFGPDGSIIGYAGSLTDIHARKIAEREVATMQMRLARALDGTGVGVWEWDSVSDTVVISGGALAISGFRNLDVDYQPIDYRGAIHPGDRPRLLAAMDDYVAGRSKEFAVEMRVRTSDRGWVWVLDRGTATARDADGRATHMVGTLTNIDQGKRAQAELEWAVDHDALTGLANRTLFRRRLDEAVAHGRCALALLDIDDFKAVNDVCGHGTGDALLRMLAERLSAFAGPGETVARLGGDEFTLIIPDCGDAVGLLARLDTLRRELDAPFDHDGYLLSCRSSIGIAIAPDHGDDASTLLKSADIAMYSAKHARRGGVALFEPMLGERVRHEASRLVALREALDAGTIEPCYESIVRLSDGALAGFEAVAHIPGDSIVDTHDSIVIGDAAVAIRLGELLLDRVLEDFAGWRAAGFAPEFVSINVALPELRRAGFAQRLLGRLAAYGIPPTCLRIEILDAGLNGGRGADRAEATIDELSRNGVRVGIDRFGAAAASLSHLTRLRLAAIKVDAQFVAGVATPGSEQTVVRAVIGLAQSFDLNSVALGVETAVQAAKLKDLGCMFAQGPLYGAPRDAAATLAALRAD